MKTYGATLSSEELERFLAHSMTRNLALAEQGERGIPICVWGSHGIGKTETVMSFAQKHGYAVVYCAPAQFEEMSDLHGLPEIYDPTPELPNNGDEVTLYRQPAWLKGALDHVDPSTPGLLILDDFNRADSRILQGCMQLLQMHSLFSWKLPDHWQIVLTANPEHGPYKVTEMDDAMITRMLHVTMTFDAPCWSKWALSAGLDSRGVEFVLTYPELISGGRTTARSFTHFLRQIGDLSDSTSEEKQWLIRVLGEGAVEPDVIAKLVYFLHTEQPELIDPLEVLTSKNIKEVLARLSSQLFREGARRQQLLATICKRLELYLTSPEYRYEAQHKKNLVAFLLNPDMDASLRFALHGALSYEQRHNPEVGKVLRDKKLAQAILGSLA